MTGKIAYHTGDTKYIKLRWIINNIDHNNFLTIDLHRYRFMNIIRNIGGPRPRNQRL